ncbi:MAG: Ig-like domain repeat protein [Methanobrevibacter sp.]|nr:Ig-like domain repeat protein [Methanobrevibacter sp.]
MFDVNHFYHILTASDLTKTYGTSNKLVVKLADNNGNVTPNAKINVTINNKVTPITTDSNGKATMPINLKPGTYTAVISYDDDQITAKIVVKKITPKLTASQKTFKKSVNKKSYTVTLKNNQNKPMSGKYVTLTVNKKTYKVKTNSKGQATFKITNLKNKGTFKAVVKYAGDNYYNSKTVNTKITVK